MKKYILVAFVISILFSTTVVFAEDRNIYVGDLIELSINTDSHTEDEIRSLFNEFEIVNLSKESFGYTITLRSFDTGEKIIRIGMQEVVIIISSTLMDFDREDIYADESVLHKSDSIFNWISLLIPLTLIFLISLIFTFRNKKVKRELTAIEQFRVDLKNTSYDNMSYLGDISICLKRYLESVLKVKINGKTSDELLEVLVTFTEFKTSYTLIESWYKECDYYKYSKEDLDKEKNKELSMNLLEILEKLEEKNEVVAC